MSEKSLFGLVARLRAAIRRFSPSSSSTFVLTGLCAVVFSQFELVSSAWAALTASFVLAAMAVTHRPHHASSTILSAVSFLPLAVSLAYGLPGPVYLVSSLPLAFGIVSEARGGWSLARCRVAFVTLAIAVGAVWIGNQYLVFQSGWDSLPATLAAATLFYLIYSVGLAVPSAALAGRGDLTQDRGALKRWSEVFFRGIPVWLLIPAALGVVSLLTEGTSILERAFGSVLFLAGVISLSRYRSASGSVESGYSAREQDLVVQTAVETLTAVAGAKNHSSLAATRRLRSFARAVAEKCACSEEEIRTMQLAAVLHDIGKVGVPDHILMKPGALTSQEFSQVASHVSLGAAILRAAKLPDSVQEVVLRHREHWDGSGYPDGLKGAEIPRLARILTIVDSFHALVNDRPFRPALGPKEAVDLMSLQRGKIFDPKLLDKLADGLSTLWETVLDAEPPQATPSDDAVSLRGKAIKQDWMDTAGDLASRNRHSLRKLTSTPDQLVAFYDILRILGADLNFDKSLKECVSILCRAMPCDKVGIFILDGESFVLMQGAGFPDHCASRLAVSSKQGLLAECVESRQIMIGSGAVGDGPDGQVPRYLDDVRSSIVAPLIADDRVIGTILLCSTTDKGFHPDQCQLMSLLTGKVASTVLSSRTLRRIYLEAETDTVTGLPNTRAVFRKLETELQRAQREHEPVAVLFMDLNNLKPVNDSFGHAAGDTLLLEVGRALKRCLRPYDFLGRVGGDEFLAIVPGIPQDQLEGKMQVLKGAIATTAFRVDKDATIHTSISVGAAVFPADGSEAEELVYLSDKRMYEDKQRTKSAANLGSQVAASSKS